MERTRKELVHVGVAWVCSIVIVQVHGCVHTRTNLPPCANASTSAHAERGSCGYCLGVCSANMHVGIAVYIYPFTRMRQKKKKRTSAHAERRQ